PMSFQPAIVLSPPKMLHIYFCGRLRHNSAEDAHPVHRRSPDVDFAAVGYQQHSGKFNSGADGNRVAVIDSNDVSLAHPILPRTIFEYRVHEPLRGVALNEEL